MLRQPLKKTQPASVTITSLEKLYETLESDKNIDLTMSNGTFLECKTYDLIYLTRHYPDFLLTLFSHFSILQRSINHTYLLFIAKNCDIEFIKKVIKLPGCSDKLDSEKKFLEIATINPWMAVLLLNDDNMDYFEKNIDLILFENLITCLRFNDEYFKNKHRQQLTALDLAVQTHNAVKRVSKVEDLWKEKRISSSYQYLANTFPTMEAYLNHMPVKSADDSIKYFLAFSATIAHQLFSVRTDMIENKQLSSEDLFNVLICSPYSENLSNTLLQISTNMAKKNLAWKSFNDHLHIRTIEKSSMLSTTGSKPKKMAVILACEFLNNLSPQKMTLNESGKLTAEITIPSITEDSLKHYFPKENFSLLKRKSLKSVSIIEILLFQKIKMKSFLLLSHDDFLRLYNASLKFKTDTKIFHYIKASIPCHFFPKLNKYINENKSFFETMKPRETRYPLLGIENFLKQANAALMPNGELITVDHGNHDGLIKQPIRLDIFKNINSEKGPRDFSFKFDVPFTTLVRQGHQWGFKKIFYGNHYQMMPNDPFSIPEIVLTEKNLKCFIDSNKTLRVCVQRKEAKEEKHTRVYSHARFFQSALPITEHELFENYKTELHMIKKIADKPAASQEAIDELNSLHSELGSLFEDPEGPLYHVSIDSKEKANLFFDVITDKRRWKLNQLNTFDLFEFLQKNTSWSRTPLDEKALAQIALFLFTECYGKSEISCAKLF